MSTISFNQVILIGRLTKDPESSQTQNGKKRAKYRLYTMCGL